VERLVRDCLELLKESGKGHVLVSCEEFDYFSVRKSVEKGIDPEMKKWVEQVLPKVVVKEEIPLDRRVQVVVLGRSEGLLQKMVKAIGEKLAPALLIDIGKEGNWEMVLQSPGLRLVVAPPLHEWQGLALSRFYQEGFFGKVPAILMRPVADYEQDPELKKTLWKMISSRLSSSTSL
jgi:hypothetical protein